MTSWLSRARCISGDATTPRVAVVTHKSGGGYLDLCASFGTLPEQFEQMIVENQRSEHSLRESTRALTGVMPQHESSTVKQREGRLQRLSTMQHGIGVCRTISTLACREHCQNPCLHPRTNLAFLRLFVVELKHCGDGSFIRALPHNAGERRGTIKERAATS